ncbi:MAG: dephospho-CoA kinase [Sphingopyxis sp.]
MTSAGKGGKPLIVGLTGSIGMGKSTVAAMLRDESVPVFDADATVHQLQGPGGALLPAIEAAFPGVTGPDGLDRAALGARVFGDSAALQRLEHIVHPAVAQAQRAFMAQYGAGDLVVLDVPLLFEKGGFAAVDRIIVVSAPADVQRARVLARPGMTAEKFDDILARQTPDAQKRARADHVIDTGVPFDQTRMQIRDVLACLRGQRGA